MIDSLFHRAEYIIRLDDASHFSNFKKWNKIERILDKYNIKPIVAVIPENMDNSISYSNGYVVNWKSKKYFSCA